MNNIRKLRAALLRADLGRVLALVFSAPTEEATANLKALCDELASTLGAENHPLHEGVAELASSLESADTLDLEHEYNALFSMDVMAPAYEGSYQQIERGAIVGDVAGYYRAFGLKPEERSGPPDSLWNELAFLSWLSLMEANAIEKDLDEQLAITREAMAEFLKDHLGRWAGAFTTRLLAATGNPIYVTAAHLLLATVSLAADDLQIDAIEPLEIRELPGEPDAVTCPLACAT